MAGTSIASSSSSPQANGHAGKRKADDDADDRGGGAAAPTHTRSKRNRYISIACNECKRRKIKCNGQTPCHRCGNLNLECVYAPNCCTTAVKDSEEFHRMREHITALQNQVAELYAAVAELQNRPQNPFSVGSIPTDPALLQDGGRSASISTNRTLPPLPAPLPRRQSQRSFPTFHGPTSSVYGFDVAKSTLQTMGITQGNGDDGQLSRDRSTNASPLPPIPHPSKDPLWLVERHEALRLCRLYEDEIHLMYPEIDMERMYKHVERLYGFLGAALRSGFAQPTLPGADAIDDEDTTLLKLVLAIALMLEGNGRSDLGERFFQSTKFAVNLKVVESLDIRSVHVMILTVSSQAEKWRNTRLTAL